MKTETKEGRQEESKGRKELKEGKGRKKMDGR